MERYTSEAGWFNHAMGFGFLRRETWGSVKNRDSATHESEDETDPTQVTSGVVPSESKKAS